MFSRIDVVVIVMASVVRVLLVVVAEGVDAPEGQVDASGLLPSNPYPKGAALQRLFSLMECSPYILRLALSMYVVNFDLKGDRAVLYNQRSRQGDRFRFIYGLRRDTETWWST